MIPEFWLVIVLVIFWLLLPAKYDPAMRLKMWLEKRLEGPPVCVKAGHDWRYIGGCNASCDLGSACSCSVPVHECTRCLDCDYGDNEEAADIVAVCHERRAAEERTDA